ncbi:hypothetical protein AAHA92_13871 [Salvia divinorum]|uniref:DEAD/DEAH-box helicase domain-containing protein n=1 Tax=Salvia divinorum TaxID=28513 RepID=A0ABD1HD44_SALDI
MIVDTEDGSVWEAAFLENAVYSSSRKHEIVEPESPEDGSLWEGGLLDSAVYSSSLKHEIVKPGRPENGLKEDGSLWEGGLLDSAVYSSSLKLEIVKPGRPENGLKEDGSLWEGGDNAVYSSIRKHEIVEPESPENGLKEDGSLCEGGLLDNAVYSSSQKHEIVEPESPENGLKELVRSVGIVGPKIAIDLGKPAWRVIKWDSSNNSWEELVADRDEGCPSKFLVMCLNSLQDALHEDKTYSSEVGRPYFANSWGFDFWSCYVKGIDVLDTDGADSKNEKIAWVTSTAAASITSREEEDEDVSINSPFLLYLVPSQEKACKVVEVCKTLEEFGLGTLFFHSGVSIDLQIQSLKSSEPEFIISTPETLLKLLSLKAIDISELPFLVIDGLEAPVEGTYLNAVKSVRQFISGNTQTVIFCDQMNTSSQSG